MGAIKTIRPQAGPQEQFLASAADIAIYGGGAGGGKTFALLLEPLRHIAALSVDASGLQQIGSAAVYKLSVVIRNRSPQALMAPSLMCRFGSRAPGNR